MTKDELIGVFKELLELTPCDDAPEPIKSIVCMRPVDVVRDIVAGKTFAVRRGYIEAAIEMLK